MEVNCERMGGGEKLVPRTILTLVLLATLSSYPTIASRTTRFVAFNPPVVYPQQDFVTVKARSNYTLTCEGHVPVFWNIQRLISLNNKDRIIVSSSLSADGKYLTNIQIKEMVYTDTATYVCSFNGTDDISSIDSNTPIHIYVYDQVHLLTQDDFDYQQFVQYETAVIPCTPTHPNITVDLRHETKQEILLDNQYITYNPKRGFLISPILPEYSGQYYCTASFQGKTSQYVTYLRVLPKTSYVPPPHINKTSGDHITVGQTMELACTITVEWSVQVKLRWQEPVNLFNSARINTPAPVSRNVSLGGKPLKVVDQRLVLHRVEKGDQGNYECIVTDHSGNTRSKREFIRIYDRDQSFLNVKHDGSPMLQKAGGDSVQWVVQVTSHPAPNITWFDPDGKEVMKGEDRENRRNMQIYPGKNYRTLLKISNLTLTDAGVYSLRADNGLSVVWENLTLIVTGKPRVTVGVINQPNSGLFAYGEHYTMQCGAVGFPRPKIDWTFVKCKDYVSCEKRPEHLVAITEHAKGRFQTDSTLTVVAKETGRYTCLATSGDNAEANYVPFFVTDYDDGFQVLGPSLVLEEEPVELRCAGSRYNYSNNAASSLTWYRQTVHGLEEIRNGHRPTRRNSGLVSKNSVSVVEVFDDNISSRFSVVRGLRFPSVRAGDSGVYVCKARLPNVSIRGLGLTKPIHNRHTVSDGSANTREHRLELRVQRYEAPVLYETVNMAGNETFLTEKGEGVEMVCRVSGTLMPQVKWLKDGKAVDLTSGNIQLVENTQTLRIGVVVEGRDEGVYSCEAANKKGRVKQFQNIIKVEAPSIYQTNLLGDTTASVSSLSNSDPSELQADGSQSPKTAGDSGVAADTSGNIRERIVLAGTSLNLKCRVTGRPPPTVTWTLNSEPVDTGRVNLTDSNQTLWVNSAEKNIDEGRYECRVRNMGGETALFQVVKVEETNLLASIFASGIAVPVSIAVGISILLAVTLLLTARVCGKRGGKWKSPPTPPTPRLMQFDLPEEEHGTESCRLTMSRDGSPYHTHPHSSSMSPVPCHGCNGCNGSCHQCSACHYSSYAVGGGGGDAIYGCMSAAGPFYGSSILGVRPSTCGTPVNTATIDYSPGSGVNMATMTGSLYNEQHKTGAHSTMPRSNGSFHHYQPNNNGQLLYDGGQDGNNGGHEVYNMYTQHTLPTRRLATLTRQTSTGKIDRRSSSPHLHGESETLFNP